VCRGIKKQVMAKLKILISFYLEIKYQKNTSGMTPKSLSFYDMCDLGTSSMCFASKCSWMFDTGKKEHNLQMTVLLKMAMI